MKILNSPKKSLGQNFLIDKNIINKIIKIGNLNKNKTIYEIGPGYGALTEKILLSKPKKCVAIEKDKKISEILNNKLKDHKNFEMVNKDFLKILEENVFDKNVVVFGNLPYNISTKILTSLITLKKWPPWYNVLIFMFQKEVANRIVAKENTKDFGRLTVLSNWRMDIKRHFDISKNCFFPKPNVDSTLLSFTPKKNNISEIKNPKNLEKVTRVLFSNRRKMINKNFKKLFKEKLFNIKKLDIDLSKRPGELRSDLFYKIAVEYEKLFS